MNNTLSYGDSIAILSFVKGAASAIDREKGVRKALDKNGKLIIEGSYYCNNFREKASEITLNILKNKPHIKGIIALNDPSTTGAARAIKEAGLKEGKLVGFLGDTHIYENHIDGMTEQLQRKPFPLPKINTKNFKSIFDWEYTDSEIEGYEHHPRIKFEIAV